MTTDRFAIVPVTHGPAPDDALVVGPMSEVFEYIPQSVARADAVQELERARFTADQITSMQSKTRGVQVSMLAETIKQLDARFDALLQRRADAVRARARRDEEEEQKRIQAKLDTLPDPDDPDAFSSTGNEDQSEFPDPDLPHAPIVSQPTAVGLDKKV